VPPRGAAAAEKPVSNRWKIRRDVHEADSIRPRVSGMVDSNLPTNSAPHSSPPAKSAAEIGKPTDRSDGASGTPAGDVTEAFCPWSSCPCALGFICAAGYL